MLNFSGAVPAAASILGLPAATSGDALASASLSAALRRGGGIPHRDSGGGIANDLSEAAGYGANGSGILASAGGSGGILQDLSDPTSSAGAGLLTALSLRRGGWVPHRDGGGGIVPGAGPFGMPGSSPMPVSLQVMALPQHGMPGNPIVGGPPRPPNAPPSSWGSTYANPNDYGGMLSGLAHSIHSSGIMGQRRGGLVRRADGGGGIMPPNMLAPPTGDDANTFVIDASAAPQAGAAPSVAGFWTQHGATPAAAQGIQAAAESESGLNPGAPGDNGTSLGLYQHHGPRLDALKDYAATQGGSPTDPNIQNQFALSEVNGGDPLATKHWDEIKSQTDPGKAQALWEKYFERPGLASRSASVQPQGIAPSAPAFMGQVTDTGEPSMGAGPASMGPPPAPSEMDRLNMPGTDPWLALAAAGFGMASGTSPFAAANIGRGAEAGINFLEQERQMLPEQRLRTAQAEQAEVTAGLTEAQLDYYANHGINTLNGNLALAGKALTGAGAGQISATNGGVSQAPSMMTLPNAGVPVPTGGEANPQFQQLDEAYRQLDFLAGAPMLPAQKAQIIEQIARLRDTDPRVAAAKAGMAAQAQVAPHIQEAGGKKAAELGSTITMSRDGTMYLGTQPIWTSAIPRPYVTSAAEATPTDPEGTPHEGFRARPMPIPVGGQQPAGGGIAPVPGSPAAIAIPNPPSALAAPHQANPNAPIGADWQTGLSPEALGHAEEAGKTRGEEEQKDRQETIEGGVAAQQQQAILSRLKDDAPQFTQGPFAGHVQAVNTYLRAMFGTQVPQVASYEDFIKNAGALTRAAVRETSSRAAVQEFKLIDATLPSPDMSPQGLNQVVNEYQGLNDYKIAKVQAQQAWEQQHGGTGNVQGFETDFQAKVSPYAFVFNRMDPDEQRGLVSRMRATSAGRAELGHLAQQLQYAKNAGLEPQ